MSLPTGTVTFFFSDIEGSTRLIQQLGERYPDVLLAHHTVLRQALAEHGGNELRTEGDSFFIVFGSALDACSGAAAAQQALQSHAWPEGGRVQVRIGLHTGEATLVGNEYLGLDVHRAARVASAAHGGQVLVSETTRALVDHVLPSSLTLKDLGLHRLKDLARPERLYQLNIDGLPGEFPALRTLEATPNNLPTQMTSFIGRDDQVREGRELLSRARLLTLTGPGGTGKTRLSLQIAADVMDQFPDGVYFVPLAAVQDPELVPSAIAQALVGLSRVELRGGAYDSVRAHAGEASALLTQTGDTLGAIGPSHMVAAVNRMTGRDSDAASLYERTLARYRSLSDGAGVAGELMNLGYVRLHQGRRADARGLFRDAVGRFAVLHDEVSQEFMVAAFAAVAADAGDASRAAQLYGAARKLLAASGVTLDPDDQYELDRYSAKARKQLGDAAYARALAQGEALSLVDALRLAQTI